MRESIRRSLKYTFATNILTGPVAQRLEQGTHNPLVVGSNPTGPTTLTSILSIGKVFVYRVRLKSILIDYSRTYFGKLLSCKMTQTLSKCRSRK